MISAIGSELGNTITVILANLQSALAGITQLFWVEPGTGETTGHLTMLGILSVFAVGAGIVFFVFNLIRALIMRGAGRAA